ncbi:MAG: hypothetical protein HC809_14690 [Gammaproteobacteria bacterium]|nr:hypothetical protein [Gammaproteobacteria bacterium]
MRRRLSKALRFLAEVAGEDGKLPALGDDDNGNALSVFWDSHAGPGRTSRLRVTFPHTGYTILRSRLQSQQQIGFDHGSLGLAPMHAHGHADALSVTWRTKDRDLLIDPGTFTYTGDPEWRHYFRSTRAHNTVTVDGRDQSTQRGPFIWQPTYSAMLKTLPANGLSVLLGSHDGYRSMDVHHWRGLIYNHEDRLIVWDYITGADSHDISLWWHFGVPVELQGDVVIGANDGLAMHIAGASTITLSRGLRQPATGWRSSTYGQKEPTPALEARQYGKLPISLTTLIALGDGSAPVVTEAEARWIAELRRCVDGR